ncbi:uncharacterized protein LDX57_000360 [Aspergillus melleus]|uniref:uncharacterized protein n=1 Tax=Aspergillus melleus TaxID=138277 RepID=UPI001E8EDEA0|nr:uncharacterized protein LDX57_000360 [Aspergillus melleus]KAH8422606.1 hypothetical protein LDX57_000360 [Aspergillus melleus]
MPPWLAPYVELSRLYQPLFVLIIYLPILAGLFHGALVAHPQIASTTILQCVVNWFPLSLLWEAFACIVNDVVDQRLDRTVERTRNRPIARGSISTTQGCIFATSVSLMILALNSQILPTSSLLYYSLTTLGCIIYAYSKRFTYYAQAVVGLVHTIVSLFASYSVGFDAFSAPRHVLVSSLSMLAAIFFLVTTYEFIYTYQDMEEDIKFGVKSMAVKYGQSGRGVLLAFSLIYGGLLILSGASGALGRNYFTGAACSIVTLFLSTTLVDLKSPQSCSKCFLYGFVAGSASLALGLFADYAW